MLWQTNVNASSLVVLALPLGVGAFEVFDALGGEVPEAGGDFVDEVVVAPVSGPAVVRASPPAQIRSA